MEGIQLIKEGTKLIMEEGIKLIRDENEKKEKEIESLKEQLRERDIELRNAKRELEDEKFKVSFSFFSKKKLIFKIEKKNAKLLKMLTDLGEEIKNEKV